MILQTSIKNSRNTIYEQSQVIECFDVIIGDDIESFDNMISPDDELTIRQKNHNKVEDRIRKTGLCRDNITWYLGDLPLEENNALTVVTLDTVTYVFSPGGLPDTMVFILNDFGKTISRVL